MLSRRNFILTAAGLLVPSTGFAGIFDLLPEPSDSGQAPGSSPFDMVGAEQSRPLETVHVYSPSWCSGCKEFERSTAHQNRFIFVFHHQESQFPDWVRQRVAAGHTWPAIHFPSGSTWKVAHGLKTFADFEKLYDSPHVQANKSTTPAPQKLITKHAALYYGRYASQWDWPGDLRSHLAGPPHNYGDGYVAGLSDGQAIALHDQWHNTHSNAGHSHFRWGLFRRG